MNAARSALAFAPSEQLPSAAASPRLRLELGMSPSAVSHAVKTVEEQLGLPLFARTTRTCP